VSIAVLAIGTQWRRIVSKNHGHEDRALPDNPNKQRILDYIRHCYAGDIEQAASYYDDDINFIAYAPIDVFPSLGQKVGKAAMTESLIALHQEFGPIEHELTCVVAEDDRVALMVDLRMTARSSERVIRIQIANFYTLRAGRIYIYRQFLDSFDAVQQKLRLDLIDQVKPIAGA
jgi:uncharacterized protein